MAGALGVSLVVVGAYVLGNAPIDQSPPVAPLSHAQPSSGTGDSREAAPTPVATAAQSPPVEAAPTVVASAFPPSRLSFPDAGVQADVVPVATLPSGALQIPDDPSQVGWYAPGALPGQDEGSTVLAGHMTSTGEGSSMATILGLQLEQAVQLEDRGGNTLHYRVVARDATPREALERSLFTTEGPHRLVLITCGGPRNPSTGQYSENVVVIAEPVR